MQTDIKQYLKDIVRRVRTYEYGFDTELTKYSQKNREIDRRKLKKVIDELLSESDVNAAFAGLYLFSIYLKNDGNNDALERIVNDYQDAFAVDEYPPILELRSRYLKRKKNDPDAWKEALECDRKAITILHSSFFEQGTFGLNASYVSTLCRILQWSSKTPQNQGDYGNVLVTRSEYDFGIECIQANIERRRETYAKDYYLKAKLVYYWMIANQEPGTGYEAVRKRCTDCDKVISLLGSAIEFEKNAQRRKPYYTMVQEVSEYQSSLAEKVSEEMRDMISSSESFTTCISPFIHEHVPGRKYVFACYSRDDYKDVFLDISSLYEMNIDVQYDNSSVKSGSEWYVKVRSMIDNDDCAAVLFFLSESVLKSDSIYKEISIVQNSGKRYYFVSKTGDTVSKMIYNLYRENEYEPLFKNTLIPDRLKTLLGFFSDSIHFLSRKENDYGRKLASDTQRFLIGAASEPETAPRYTTGLETVVNIYKSANNRSFDGVRKPNEDFGLADEELGFFIVADGVTRPHSEYDGSGKSFASDVTVAFCNAVHEHIKKYIASSLSISEAQRLIQEAFAEGNRAAANVNESQSDMLETFDSNQVYFKPATVAAAVLLFKGEMCFAYAGDCLGYLIRGNSRIRFAEMQTAYTRQMQVKKAELYSQFVNKHGKRGAYGIFNGDEAAADFLSCGHLKLEHGDKIILSSDGLYPVLEYERPEILQNLYFVQLIPELAEHYSKPPFSEYNDDMFLIEVTVKQNG